MPEGWAWVRLSVGAELFSDGDHQPPPQTSSGIPFLIIPNVPARNYFLKAGARFDDLFYLTASYWMFLTYSSNLPNSI